MVKRYCDICGQQIDEGVHAWYVFELHGTDGEFRHKEFCEECYEYLCKEDEVPTADRKTDDIAESYLRGWNNALDAVKNGKFVLKTSNCSEKPNNCDDEPQKKEVEWVYNKRERLWYPYSNGELLFKTEPQKDCDKCKWFQTYGKCVFGYCYYKYSTRATDGKE